MWGFIVLIFFFLVFPIILGVIFTLNLNEKYKKISFVYVVGFIGMMALFYIPCVVATLLQIRFSILVVIYTIMLCIICLTSWKIYCVEIKQVFSFNLKRYLNINKIWVVILLLIAYQMLRSVLGMPYIYADDKSYIAMINDIISNDVLYRINPGNGLEISLYEVSYKYVFASYYPFLAMISKCSGIHPLIICKTYFPIVCVLLHYVITYILAKILFNGNVKKIGIFMLLYVVLCEFFTISWYTISLRLLIWSWHNKAFMAVVILPFIFAYGSDVFDRSMSKWEYIILLLVSLVACSTTLFGAVLASIMYMLISITKVIKKHDIRFLQRGLICSIPTVVIVVCAYLWRMFIIC